MLNLLSCNQETHSNPSDTINNPLSWTLMFIHYGSYNLAIEEEEITLIKGDLLLIPPKLSFKSHINPLIEKYTVTFEINHGKPLLPLFETTKYILSNTGKFEIIADRFLTIQSQWVEKIPYYEVMGQALLLEILTHWSRELDCKPRSTVKDKHIQAMKSYIQNHYRERVTKDDLGWVIKKSPNYAASLFRAITGLTISESIHRLRVKTAIYMLQHSQLNVSDVAEFLGYSDTSYFHKVFKRINGSSPSDLLQNKDII